MNWYVLYTRPQAELKTAKYLEKLGVEVYCPLTSEVRQWSDRKKLVKSPLFKSHIFVRVSENQRTEVFQVSSAVRYLMWLGKPAIVRDEEIETLRSWLEGNQYDEVQVHSLTPGEKVQIHNGAFKGRNGVIKEVGKREVKMVLESLNVVVTTKLKDVLG